MNYKNVADAQQKVTGATITQLVECLHCGREVVGSDSFIITRDLKIVVVLLLTFDAHIYLVVLVLPNPDIPCLCK